MAEPEIGRRIVAGCRRKQGLEHGAVVAGEPIAALLAVVGASRFAADRNGRSLGWPVVRFQDAGNLGRLARKHRDGVEVFVVSSPLEADAAGAEQRRRRVDGVEKRGPIAVEQPSGHAAVRPPDHFDPVPVVPLVGLGNRRADGRVQREAEEVFLEVHLSRGGREHQRIAAQRTAVRVRVGAEEEVGPAVG